MLLKVENPQSLHDHQLATSVVVVVVVNLVSCLVMFIFGDVVPQQQRFRIHEVFMIIN